MPGQEIRFSKEELALFKAAFQNNEPLLKLMRKVFLPTYDFDAPLGQVIDLWMTIDLANLSPRDAEIRIWARNSLITHVEQQLMQMKILANPKEETPEEKAKKAEKDSTK